MFNKKKNVAPEFYELEIILILCLFSKHLRKLIPSALN